ncbi:MAG: prolipoprotein diacylglyceryl transferase [Candidatus Goldbacteria bacterium]|nr:prolipoprotein diacylglyceryl transferase [Candidatus Goldiibacteriota bacterium]
MHPILFEIAGLKITTYGLMVAIAFLSSIYLAAEFAKKQGIKSDVIFDLGFIVIIWGIIGARLLYVLIWYKDYIKDPLSILKVWEGGLVFYGGFIAAFLAAVIWVIRKKLDFFKLADIAAPFIAFGHSIARIGCFFAGCCYGRASDCAGAFCGVIFPVLQDNTPRYPAQLYESFANFLNFLLLMIFYKKFKKENGDVIFLYLLNYGIIRTIIEFFRGDPERGKIFFFSTSSFISLVMILSAGLWFFYFRHKKTWKKQER